MTQAHRQDLRRAGGSKGNLDGEVEYLLAAYLFVWVPENANPLQSLAAGFLVPWNASQLRARSARDIDAVRFTPENPRVFLLSRMTQFFLDTPEFL